MGRLHKRDPRLGGGCGVVERALPTLLRAVRLPRDDRLHHLPRLAAALCVRVRLDLVRDGPRGGYGFDAAHRVCARRALGAGVSVQLAQARIPPPGAGFPGGGHPVCVLLEGTEGGFAAR